METALLSGLLGILGGIVSGLIVSILSQRKNNAEIKRLEAETKKINIELENAYTNERKEILTKIHDLMHIMLGFADYLGRSDRGKYLLNDKSDEYILGFVEDRELSKFQIQRLLKAEDKSKFYQEQMIWYELNELDKSKIEYHNYIVGKEIILDDEEFIKACGEFDKIMEIFLKSIGDSIRQANSDLIDLIVAEIYTLYKSEFDQYQKRIDDYIKSQLRPNRSKT